MVELHIPKTVPHSSLSRPERVGITHPIRLPLYYGTEATAKRAYAPVPYQLRFRVAYATTSIKNLCLFFRYHSRTKLSDIRLTALSFSMEVVAIARRGTVHGTINKDLQFFYATTLPTSSSRARASVANDCGLNELLCTLG
jgi:hypothetical protein